MLELLETPPAGEVVTGKRWLPDNRRGYIGLIRRAMTEPQNLDSFS